MLGGGGRARQGGREVPSSEILQEKGVESIYVFRQGFRRHEGCRASRGDSRPGPAEGGDAPPHGGHEVAPARPGDPRVGGKGAPPPSGRGSVSGGVAGAARPARRSGHAGTCSRSSEISREGLLQPCPLAALSPGPLLTDTPRTPTCAHCVGVSLLDTNPGLTLSFLENLNNSVFSLHNAQPLKSLICPLGASRIFLFKIQHFY